MLKRQQINLTGQVQGVGARPFIYRTAIALGLTGLVYNDTKGASIQIQGDEEKIAEFTRLLQSAELLPPLMKIATMDVCDIKTVPAEKDFLICTSDPKGTPASQLSGDIATCCDCLSEINERSDFRFAYPFINCTNCGPRYSIIKNIPYDRANTTMVDFAMCPKCSQQYLDPHDRRFHAQPVACPACGPKITLTDNTGKALFRESAEAIKETASLLVAGKIVAIKGIGGYHLAANATNQQAVEQLRQRKRRDHKPFALMVSSIDSAKKFALVDKRSQRLLDSPQRPIVLLPKKDTSKIAPSVAEGVNTLGVMLCYSPLHYLLFARDGIDILVMTSANLSDEPLICDNTSALAELADIADFFLTNDRDIYRRVDDSVVHIIDGQQAILRRSRGFVPTPVLQNNSANCNILAAGADLKNTFCLGRDNMLILSEHIGDLADGKTYRHYKGSINHLQKLFELSPQVIACDLHPGYLSTQHARSLKPDKLIEVQHHWAHIASVLAEHNCDEKVIGLVADGTGFGTDGAIWGCECLIASLEDFTRVGHLKYYSLSGGDRAAKEPIRPLMGLLAGNTNEYQSLLEDIEPDSNKRNIIAAQLKKNLNTVQTSSLGRLFDTIAAICGFGTYNHFDAQLPMALESAIADGIDDCCKFTITPDPAGMMILDYLPIVADVIAQRGRGTDPAIIAARFHNTIAAAFAKWAQIAAKKFSLNTVALSGGVFCNRYLANRLISMLKRDGFVVFSNRDFPATDGGIALGQAAIAAAVTKN